MIQRTEKPINFIYFYIDLTDSRIPLIAGSVLGNNLDSVIHPSSEFKKLISEQLPPRRRFVNLYIWIDGTEFRIGDIWRERN